MEQMRLYFEGEEFKSIKGIVPRCYKKVRNKYKQVAGESTDDFRNFIVCETLLEIAEKLGLALPTIKGYIQCSKYVFQAKNRVSLALSYLRYKGKIK